MVKNVKGGKGHKHIARKNIVNDYEMRHMTLRKPENENEIFAAVVKIYGNAMCNIITSGGLTLMCHIRKKFRERSKRNHFISSGSFIMIGLRDWENPPKNCDLLEVYEQYHVSEIISMPMYNISQLLPFLNGFKDDGMMSSDSTLFQDSVEPILSEEDDKKHMKHEITMVQTTNEEDINIDDI